MNHVEIKRRQIEMLSWLLGILTVWILAATLGQGGIGYFTVAIVVCICFSIIPAGNVGDVLGKVLRSRNIKGQYKSVCKSKKHIFIFQSILGVLSALLLFGCATPIAEYVFNTPYAAMIMRMLAPAILFRTITEVLLGGFQGEGTELPTILTCVIRQIFILGFGLVFGHIFMNYGTKISALLQQEQFVTMYGGVGIALAISLTELLLVIFLLVIYKGSRHTYKRQNTEGKMKEYSLTDSVSMFCAGRGKNLLADILNILPLIIGLIFYQRNVQDLNVGIINLEAYVLKYLLICALVIIPICAFMIPYFAKMYSRVRKEDQRHVRNIFHMGLHMGVVNILFPAVFLSCLSDQIAGLFGTMGQQRAADMLSAGSFVIVFVLLNYYFGNVLKVLGKQNYVLISLGVYNILFIGMLVLFLSVLKLDIMSLVYGGMIANMLYCLILGYCLYRQIRYNLRMVFQLAIPVIAAAVTGILCLLVAKLLMPYLGNGLTLLVGGILTGSIYWVILLLLRNIRKQELDSMPGGFVIRKLGEVLSVF